MEMTERYPLIERAYLTRRDGDRRGALALYIEGAQMLSGAAGASAWRHAADLYAELEESASAWDYYVRAWTLYGRLDPTPELDLANCRRPMALWQERHGDRNVALDLWRETLSLYERAALATGFDLKAAFVECDRHIAALAGQAP